MQNDDAIKAALATLAAWLTEQGYPPLPEHAQPGARGGLYHRVGLPTIPGIAVGGLKNPYHSGAYLLIVTLTEVIAVTLQTPYNHHEWVVRERHAYADEATLQRILKGLVGPHLGMWASRVEQNPTERDEQIKAHLGALLELCAGDEDAILDALGELFPAGTTKEWLLVGRKVRYQ